MARKYVSTIKVIYLSDKSCVTYTSRAFSSFDEAVVDLNKELFRMSADGEIYHYEYATVKCV